MRSRIYYAFHEVYHSNALVGPELVAYFSRIYCFVEADEMSAQGQCKGCGKKVTPSEAVAECPFRIVPAPMGPGQAHNALWDR